MSDNEYEESDIESGSESEVEIDTIPKKIKSTLMSGDNDDVSVADSDAEEGEEDEDYMEDDLEDDLDEEKIFNESSSKKRDSQKSKLTNSTSPVPNVLGEYSSDDEDEDDDINDPEYFKKFDENIKHNIITEYHPEMVQHNYQEVEILTHVVRNEHGLIVDPFHKTLQFLTKYEKARILGERANQLNAGATPFVPVEPHMIDGYLIALKELEEKKIPFIIKRPLPNGGCEYWKLKDLEFIH